MKISVITQNLRLKNKRDILWKKQVNDFSDKYLYSESDVI